MIKALTINTGFLFFALACGHTVKLGDRRLSKKEAPDFLIEASQGHPNAEYFEKVSSKARSYEAKFSREGLEISVTFDEKGNFIEREEDTRFSLLDSPARTRIEKHLSEDYEGAKILETERRRTPSGDFIDIEIRHPSSPSGYWELSFTPDGTYHSREVENYDIPVTHN